MEVSESDAQKESVSELRRILKISGLVTKKEVAKMGYLDLWGFVHQVVRGRVQSRPPPTSNPSEVSELLRAGLLGCLIRFLIEFSPLNSKCKRRLFPVSFMSANVMTGDPQFNHVVSRHLPGAKPCSHLVPLRRTSNIMLAQNFAPPKSSGVAM